MTQLSLDFHFYGVCQICGVPLTQTTEKEGLKLFHGAVDEAWGSTPLEFASVPFEVLAGDPSEYLLRKAQVYHWELDRKILSVARAVLETPAVYLPSPSEVVAGMGPLASYIAAANQITSGLISQLQRDLGLLGRQVFPVSRRSGKTDFLMRFLAEESILHPEQRIQVVSPSGVYQYSPREPQLGPLSSLRNPQSPIDPSSPSV